MTGRIQGSANSPWEVQRERREERRKGGGKEGKRESEREKKKRVKLTQLSCRNTYIMSSGKTVINHLILELLLLLLYKLHLRRVSLYGQIAVVSCQGLVQLENQGVGGAF